MENEASDDSEDSESSGEDDNMVINCAVEGNVDYVVTQDEHLLKIKEFKGIKIVKPEEFLWAFEKV